ncbi:hypothetical protein [Lysobacter sp. Root690]|uniref:hypothetical protein n=1 Tax=Lysobacter sp. Root690 TaxID=1736588 RepID=UPI0012FC1538|nr:hypothetical protein [Lysobacter sp. Root690]
MHRIVGTLLLAGLTLAAGGCGAGNLPPATGPVASHEAQPPPPPDTGDIAHFHGCTTLPRRELSAYEDCLVGRLKNQCTPAADCVLTCLASPHGHSVGGGCDHVCFDNNLRFQRKDRPTAMDQCREASSIAQNPGAAQEGSGPAEGLMTREQALPIARKAATAHGYDLERYSLDTFGNELSEDGGEWMFGFLCKPVPPPGCMFLVVVDRRTGIAEVFPGE